MVLLVLQEGPQNARGLPGSQDSGAGLEIGIDALRRQLWGEGQAVLRSSSVPFRKLSFLTHRLTSPIDLLQRTPYLFLHLYFLPFY